jgi:hypothetical protein
MNMTFDELRLIQDNNLIESGIMLLLGGNNQDKFIYHEVVSLVMLGFTSDRIEILSIKDAFGGMSVGHCMAAQGYIIKNKKALFISSNSGFSIAHAMAGIGTLNIKDSNILALKTSSGWSVKNTKAARNNQLNKYKNTFIVRAFNKILSYL